jgi:ribosomal protein S18 acetylase RimI-like enzyme
MEIETLRELLATQGPGVLTFGKLEARDLPDIWWAGSPTHLRNVALKLEAAARGELDYLAARAPDGTPVAKGYIDYATGEAEGTIGQLATRPELQGLGIATRLINAAEACIRERGRRWAVIGVEAGEDRTRRFYERLGYAAWTQQSASWETDDGTYHTEIVLLRKDLHAPQ